MDNALLRQPLAEVSSSEEEEDCTPLETTTLLRSGIKHPAKESHQDVVRMLWTAGPSFIGLGIASGCVVSTYLTAGGYLGEKAGSPLVLGLQSLMVNCLNLVVVLFQELLDDPLDHMLGVEVTYSVRIIGAGLVASLALLVVPLATTTMSALAVGALLSFCALTQNSTAMQLSSVMVPGGGALVALGGSLGGLVPLLTTSVFGFVPGCLPQQAYLYFGAGGIIGVSCTAWWAAELCLAVGAGSSSKDPEAVGQGSSHDAQGTGELVRGAYKVLTEAVHSPHDSELSGRRTKGCCEATCSQAPLGIFVCMSAGFATVPLFTAGTPMAAQALCLAKALGDCLGRVLALAHTVKCSQRGYAGPWVRHGATGLILLRTLLCALLIFSFLSHSVEFTSPSLGCTVVLIFTLGSYGLAMLDLDAQLEAGGKARRKAVQRWNLVMMFAGQLLGVGMGILLRWRLDPFLLT